MKRADMRSLSRAARFARRLEVIRLRKSGGTYEAIAAQLGLSRTGVFDICKRHQAAGAPGLSDRATGRSTGQGRLLEPAQEVALRQVIAGRTPTNCPWPFPLWTREAVRRLVLQRFGIPVSLRTVGTYIARWGFVHQELARATPPSAAWSALDYPALVDRARTEDGEIQWAHTLALDPGWSAVAVRAASPAVAARVVRDADTDPPQSMTSATNNRGQARWKVYADAPGADRRLDFMQRLVKATPRKVFLIFQGLPTDRSDAVASWLDEHVDDIEIFASPIAAA